MEAKEQEMKDVWDEMKPIDLTPLISDKMEDKELINTTSELITNSFRKYGVVIVKDPRITYEKNEIFLDLMEDYFNQSTQIKNKDIREELAFQVGATPSKQEIPRNHCQRISNIYNKNKNDDKATIHSLDNNHKPRTPCPPEADPKWRYFWRLASDGIDPNNNKNKNEYITLNSSNVIPKGLRFKEWNKICDEWGVGLLNAAKTISEGISIGLGLKDRKYFIKKMENAPHLLAPTATDLNKYGKYGTIIAGYHYDLNFLTVHGKSRYPGLYIFLRDGQKIRVKVPDGCLLCQAAKQLEWLTGGIIYAGFHEVCVNEATLHKIKSVQISNDKIDKNGTKQRQYPLWRVSSTMFGHINSKIELEPIKQSDVETKKYNFRTEESLKLYPKKITSEQVMDELKAIGLVIDSK